MEDEFKAFKLGIRKIANGYIVTRLGEEKYFPLLVEGLKELRFTVDAIEKETLATKSTPPQTSKPPVGVR